MYAYFQGKPVSKGKDFVIIDVGNIGYRIFTSQSTLQRISLEMPAVTLFTHLHVRENELTLYGFATQEELALFKMLLSVSGIGPKVALSVLSCIEVANFYTIIINQDTKALSKVPGIGKKTASRLILELKEKVSALPISVPQTIDQSETASNLSSPEAEAIEALQSLGYDAQEACRAVRLASKQSETQNVQQLLRYALKSLARI